MTGPCRVADWFQGRRAEACCGERHAYAGDAGGRVQSCDGLGPVAEQSDAVVVAGERFADEHGGAGPQHPPDLTGSGGRMGRWWMTVDSHAPC
jgi:hypothetical protein